MSPVPHLSAVEEQIVLLVARGRSQRSIARELGLSVRTVEWHVVRARVKLARVAALHDYVMSPDAARRGGEEQ